jgi:hypothetical protein
MPVPIEFHTTWRKSSFSGGDANCVEIAFGTWRKSSTSGPDSNCVEVAYAAEVLAVRDSKNPEGGYLVFPPGALSAVWRRG